MRRKISKLELERLYIQERKTILEISKETGLATGTVYNYLKKFAIPTRKRHDYDASDKEREAWRRIGKASKGKKLSEETKEKISVAKRQSGIGHKKKRADGYIAIYFPDHPKANKEGYVMEHVLVMEALIGRHLTDDECVHHKNEDRADNRKDNLELMTKSGHISHHMKKRHELKRRNDLSI